MRNLTFTDKGNCTEMFWPICLAREFPSLHKWVQGNSLYMEESICAMGWRVGLPHGEGLPDAHH